jgi:hypothetical protein
MRSHVFPLDSKSYARGHSSAGRALPWHGRGRRFDPDWLHQLPFHQLPQRSSVFHEKPVFQAFVVHWPPGLCLDSLPNLGVTSRSPDPARSGRSSGQRSTAARLRHQTHSRESACQSGGLRCRLEYERLDCTEMGNRPETTQGHGPQALTSCAEDGLRGGDVLSMDSALLHRSSLRSSARISDCRPIWNLCVRCSLHHAGEADASQARH